MVQSICSLNPISVPIFYGSNLETFNWHKSYKIVIEQVIQLGTLDDWREMMSFYSLEQIHETVDRSKQLDNRDKNFALLFVQSDYFLDEVRQ